MKGSGMSQQCAPASLRAHPVTAGDNVQILPRVTSLLNLKKSKSIVTRAWIFQLRAIPAIIREPLAITRMMTAAGKRIHVVQRPNDGQVRRQRRKEAWLINPARNPVQVHHIGARPKILQRDS